MAPRTTNRVECAGCFVRHNANAFLFFDDKTGQEVWIPYGKLGDWWFTSDCSQRGLEVRDLELDDEITIEIPYWLAKNECLV